LTPGAILNALTSLSALVVGDICLDRWCTYDPATSEPSRETGIPRVGVVRTLVTPGAGGTVANNLVALGVKRVTLLGAFGDDGFGYELLQALGSRGISPELMVRSSDISTFTYTKLLNSQTGEEDLPRIDFIRTDPLPTHMESEILRNLETYIHLFDAVLVSDQAETEQGGVVTSAMRGMLADLAIRYPSKIIWVDSRMRLELFRGMILKANESEFQNASRRACGAVDYQKLLSHTGSSLAMMTRGPEGALVLEPHGSTTIASPNVARPVDICGAGDSFSAGAAMALAAGARPAEAARFGNLVASITIMKAGTGTASPGEVLAACRDWPA
jgi:rfaE bifunctional protein kinase chain/domain